MMSGTPEANQKTATQLRSCTLCGTQISPYSLFCRNCGHPQGRPLIIALLVLFLLMLLTFYVGFTLFCACNPERFEVSSAQLRPHSALTGTVKSPFESPTVRAGKPS